MSCCKKRRKGRINAFFKGLSWEIRCINTKAAIIGGLCVLAGGIISYFVGGSPTYLLKMLEMPSTLPTRWCFKVIWTISYLLIGAAFGITLSAKERHKQIYKYQGNMFFVIMLIFNYIWYPLFFGAEAIFLAMVSCIAMIILDFFIIRNYCQIGFLCTAMMILYLLLLVYMLCLNAVILFIN